MNAFLMMSACMAGADPVAAPIVTVSHTASAGCGGCGTAAPACGNSCDSGCGKASLLDRIRARFAKSDNCGCDTAPKCCAKPAKTCCEKPAPVCCPTPAPACCEKAPRCKPACGTPLFSGHGCKKDSCDSCDSGCGSKPSLLDKLRAKFASKKSCCDSAPACGGCATAPAGCSLPPAPHAVPTAPPADAPKVMPAPPKKTTGLIVPPAVTPASSNSSPEFVVPAIPQIAPAPTPVLGGTKSPF